jgi:hypothetical protein
LSEIRLGIKTKELHVRVKGREDGKKEVQGRIRKKIMD